MCSVWTVTRVAQAPKHQDWPPKCITSIKSSLLSVRPAFLHWNPSPDWPRIGIYQLLPEWAIKWANKNFIFENIIVFKFSCMLCNIILFDILCIIYPFTAPSRRTSFNNVGIIQNTAESEKRNDSKYQW